MAITAQWACSSSVVRKNTISELLSLGYRASTFAVAPQQCDFTAPNSVNVARGPDAVRGLVVRFA